MDSRRGKSLLLRRTRQLVQVLDAPARNPSPAEFLPISIRLNDLPNCIGIGPRFTAIIP